MTIRLRQMTCAYLRNGSDVLLMKRSDETHIAPGLWACIGGHLEPGEISDPAVCALREIEEETGIAAHQILDFRLQAVVMRRRSHEIRTQYVYFGMTNTRALGQTAEGTLHWIPLADMLGREMSTANRFVLEKYLRDGLSEAVWVGVLGNRDGAPFISWATVADWE